MPDAEDPDRLLTAFDWQARWCATPSPFTAQLLTHTRDWLATPAGAEAHAALGALTPDPMAGAVALRWAAALHHLALRGLSPWAAQWPSTAPGAMPVPDAAGWRRLIEAAWHGQRAHLAQALAQPPQTNEVARCAVLLPGLLTLARRTGGRPIHLLELGSSAGLNLWPERWQVDYGSWRWGAADAPLGLRAQWVGPAPLRLPARLEIAGREGCDPHPIRLSGHAGADDAARRLLSFIWPDQTERLLRLRAAIAAVAQAEADRPAGSPPLLHAQPASDFLARTLAEPRPGRLVVVQHSIVWQYLDAAEQGRVTALIEAAGARATREAPLAWLRMEPAAPDRPVDLRARLWPDGGDLLLARVHPHGQRVEWLVG